MNAAIKTYRHAWEDRWVEPTLAQLLEPYKDPAKRKVVDTLLEKLGHFPGIEYELIWYGSAWRWTACYSLLNGKGQRIEVMAYFVPNPAGPLLCIPMSEEVVSRLPIKRLNRIIREGIRSSKCAVSLHWAVWSPSALTEVDHLADLFKRKHKLVLASENPTK
jgi:hypothetical protein